MLVGAAAWWWARPPEYPSVRVGPGVVLWVPDTESVRPSGHCTWDLRQERWAEAQEVTMLGEQIIGSRGDFVRVRRGGQTGWISGSALDPEEHAYLQTLVASWRTTSDDKYGCWHAHLDHFADANRAMVSSPGSHKLLVDLQGDRHRRLLPGYLESCQMNRRRTLYECGLDMTFGEGARIDSTGNNLGNDEYHLVGPWTQARDGGRDCGM